MKSRIGQGRYRADLLRVWNGRCAVTGLRSNHPLEGFSH